MDLFPRRPPGAAHRLRRHRRRDPGDQRRRRRPLPAQAVGPAGGEALPGGRRAARGLARAAATRPVLDDPGRRAPLVGAVVRGPRLPGPQPGALPLVRPPTRPEGRRLLDAAGVDAGGDPAGGHPRRATRWPRPTMPSWPQAVGLATTPGHATSTTWSSSAAARPGSARRCTAPPRACAPCWSSGRPPAGRPGRARGSRTTWASPTASPAPSSPTGPAGRPRKFGAEVLTTREVDRLEVRGSARVRPVRRRQRDRRARRRAGHRRRLPALDAPGVAELDRRGRLLRLGARPRRPACAGPGRLHRRRRQLGRPGRGVLRPGTPGRSRCWSAATGLEASMSHYLIEQLAAIAEHPRAHLHRGRRRATATTTSSGSTLRDTATPARPRR